MFGLGQSSNETKLEMERVRDQVTQIITVAEEITCTTDQVQEGAKRRCARWTAWPAMSTRWPPRSRRQPARLNRWRIEPKSWPPRSMKWRLRWSR